MNKDQTGVASEFWFFSQLQRLGYQSFITLGNTKKIDIALKLEDGKILTFDVKGKFNFNGSFQYLSNIDQKLKNHFVVFVNLSAKKSSDSKKVELIDKPDCYIVAAKDLDTIAFKWQSSKGTKGYGFEAKLLWYLKYKNDKSITKKNINDFKLRQNINEIDFIKYNSIIMSMQDFENKYNRLK